MLLCFREHLGLKVKLLKSKLMGVRLATLEDISEIISLKRDERYPKYQKRVEETIRGKGEYLILEEEGEIVGQVFLKYYGTARLPDCPNIEDLFVREDKRGQGLGTKLLKKCQERSKEKGFKKISLSVNPSLNPRARSLYQRMGFKEVNEALYLGWVTPEGLEEWLLDMVKELE